MIHSLSIENYAIIKELDMLFDKSLNIITGETGAGKSIIMGALGLIMGQRVDTSVLYEKDSKCKVEAVFVNYPPGINAILEEADYDIDDELIIRREISASGKSRAFVNDTPAKLSLLKDISSQLIDLNSQFEVTAIHQAQFQTDLIDAYADNTKLIQEYRSKYSSLKKIDSELQELESMESQQLKELDFIKFQFKELQDASLEADEQKDLEAERQMAERSGDLKLLMEESSYSLSESEQSIISRIRELMFKWEQHAEINDDIKQAVEQFNSVEDGLERISDLAANLQGSLDHDPQRMDMINERLDLIYTLQRKHQVQTIDELLQISEELESRLEAFDNKSDRIAKLKKEKDEYITLLNKLALQLRSSREKVFTALENEINGKLASLSMASAAIKVERKDAQEFNRNGLDEIQILFKANKGAEFHPVKKIASGGESARLMLALKSTVAHAMDLPTMIFDEIDSGVSGEVAGKMGDILKTMSKEHQLLCITHSPQVAARAVRHFFVYKQDAKDRTHTLVRTLEMDDRINEIAKMLSGNPPTAFALENAKELIKT